MKIVPQEVELLRSQGSDLDVVNAARVSFSKHSGRLEDRDIKLIRYLALHNHWTPFGHVFLTFRIKAPIFVARQLVKHQVGLVWNEVSRRYVTEEPEFYIPDTIRNLAPNIKQGSEGTHKESAMWKNIIIEQCEDALETYQMMVNNQVGPEQARMVLPLNTMTEWIWSGSLMAFSRVYKLRIDPHSQLETREIAAAINHCIPNELQHSWKALTE